MKRIHPARGKQSGLSHLAGGPSGSEGWQPLKAGPHATDDELMAGIVRGDAEAFSEVFRRRQRDVFRFALHMTGGSAAAEDVTQDVFLTLMRDAARYEAGRSGLTAWLLGIARNCARRRLQAERDHVPLQDGAEEEALPCVQVDPVGDLTRAEAIERLRRAVLTLPLRYREVIVLCDLQELSYEDAADVAGCAVGTIRSRLHRGRALLAAKLARTADSSTVVPIKTARCCA
jgi:RNA polymerase sigma-70 factor, ECF subfamily